MIDNDHRSQQLRLSLANAATADDFRSVFAGARKELRKHPKDDGERYEVVRSIGTVSYYVYIYGERPSEALHLIEEAEAVVRATRDPVLRLRGELVLAIARHRLYRNHDWKDQITIERRKVVALRRKVTGRSPDVQDIPAATLELSHGVRYTGDTTKFFDAYSDLPDHLWHLAGVEYQHALTIHYPISFACDWVELLAIPLLLSDNASELRKHLDHLLFNLLALISATPEGMTYPVLAVSYYKHKSLFLAARGDFDGADRAFRDLIKANKLWKVLKKPNLLYRQFDAIIRAIRAIALQKPRELAVAKKLLEGVTEEALKNSYYPRCGRRAQYHLGWLAHIDGNSHLAAQYFKGASAGARHKHFRGVCAAMARWDGQLPHEGAVTLFPHKVLEAFEQFVPEWLGFVRRTRWIGFTGTTTSMAGAPPHSGEKAAPASIPAPRPARLRGAPWEAGIDMGAEKEWSFWGKPPDLEELARTQGVKPVESIESLAGDFWPEDESIDEFIATIHAWRHEQPPPRKRS